MPRRRRSPLATSTSGVFTSSSHAMSMLQRFSGRGSSEGNRPPGRPDPRFANISEFFSTPQNNFNLRDDRGLADNDQQHRLVISGSLSSPTAVAGEPFWRRAVSGFQLSYIFSYGSALPFQYRHRKRPQSAQSLEPAASECDLRNGGDTSAGLRDTYRSRGPETDSVRNATHILRSAARGRTIVRPSMELILPARERFVQRSPADSATSGN